MIIEVILLRHISDSAIQIDLAKLSKNLVLLSYVDALPGNYLVLVFFSSQNL